MNAKILMLSAVFPPRVGGSGRWFWELYRRLPPERVVVATDLLDGQPEEMGFPAPVVRLPLPFSDRSLRRDFFAYLCAARQLRALVRRQHITCIHAGRCLPEGLLALLLGCWLRLPFSCYVHGEDLSVTSTSRELALLNRLVLRWSSRVIANSRSSHDLVARLCPAAAGKIAIVHPGVDTQRFVPATRDQTLRDRLGWGNRLVILTAGRLQKRKGQDHLIRAVARLRLQFPDLLCCIVGDGAERHALQELVRKLHLEDHVQFLLEIDDEALVGCYQQCDLFVLANRTIGADFEGFGMVLLEAQACGKPVLAGTSGGTAETMSVPDTGLCVPCDEPEPLAQALAELLRDPERRARMGHAARQWATAHFDWDVLARRAGQLFFGNHAEPNPG